MKIYRSAIPTGRPLELDEDVDFSGYDFAKDYPLLGIENAHIQGLVERNGDILTVNATVSGTLILADSRDLKPFGLDVCEKDVFDLLSEMDEENEGYLFHGNGIELSEVVYAYLRSFVPIQPLRKGSELPSSGDGYRVYSEGDEVERGPSPFDVLADYDFDDDKEESK